MEKYSLITNHLRDGKLVLAGDDQLNLKVSSIVDSGSKTNIPRSSVAHNSINGFLSKQSGGFSHLANHNVINDLIPYPSSAISTIIEKVNGTEPMYFENNNRIVQNATRSPGKSLMENLKRRAKLESPQRSRNAILKNDQSSPKTSVITSPQQQTVPSDDKVDHTSSVSFDSDDIVRIVKQLQEKKESSTQTDQNQCTRAPAVQQCNQYVQVSWGEEGSEFGASNNSIKLPTTVTDLNRSNQTLRGTIDQLSYIVEQMSKERSATTLQMHSLSKTLNAREAKIAELVAEREKHIADNDELRFAMKNIEALMTDYQTSLLGRNAEVEKLRAEVVAGTAERNHLLSQLEQNKVELKGKEDLVAELYRVNAVNAEEMTAARTYCAGLGEQLTRCNQEVANLFATKSALEKRVEIAEAVTARLQEQQSQCTATVLQTVHAKCTELRSSLQALRASSISDCQSAMQEWTSRKDDILRQMEVASLLSSANSMSNERLNSPK